MTAANLLSDDVVKEVILKACGDDAVLLNWNIEALSENFNTLECLKTTVSINGCTEQHSFVVKHAIKDGDDGNSLYRHRAFKKEDFFYNTLAPLFNEALKDTGVDSLHIPALYYSTCSTAAVGQQVMVFQDLRSLGFEMSRSWILDETHTRLAVNEVGKLHGASFLLQEDQLGLIDRYPLLHETFFMGDEYNAGMKQFFSLGTKGMAEDVCVGEDYKELRCWLKRMEPHSLAFITQLLTDHGAFSAVAHGDFHSQNMMFKYNAAGEPTDVMLIDFQVIRVMSVAVDLSYLLHFSILTSERIKFQDNILDVYFHSLSEVLKGKVPFTKSEFQKEMKANKTGFFYGLLLLGIAVVLYKSKVKAAEDNNDQESFRKFSKLLAEFTSVTREIADEANKLQVYEKFSNFESMLWKPSA